MSEEKEDKNKVNEPTAPYIIVDKVRVFNSFKEMNEADDKELAKFTPAEHLQHVTEYLMHLYSEELKHEITDMTIRFNK